jgi:hypothetical protein
LVDWQTSTLELGPGFSRESLNRRWRHLGDDELAVSWILVALART